MLPRAPTEDAADRDDDAAECSDAAEPCDDSGGGAVSDALSSASGA